MQTPSVRVAHGLLLDGQRILDGALSRADFLREIGVKNNSFRSSAGDLGARASSPGLRFFDSSTSNSIGFGPGAGLVLGISIGITSLQVAIVDANGSLHHEHRSDALPQQLALAPMDLLRRIREAAATVLSDALADPRLLVDEALPFLGVAVAWGVPIDRDRRPYGALLGHPSWHIGAPLQQRIATELGVPIQRSHALGMGPAAALAIAWRRGRDPAHRRQTHTRIVMAVRLGGAINGGIVIVEPPRASPELGQTSGFLRSTLVGGHDMLAGEFGHLPLDAATVDAYNADRPAGLGPLTPRRCSCAAPGDPAPSHLEAYCSTAAVAHRIAPGKPVGEVIRAILIEPRSPAHERALQDVGALAGRALIGPVVCLNPSAITLLGPLAAPTVAQAAMRGLADQQPFGTVPDIRALHGFVELQGAALAVLRARVHRRFGELLGGRKEHTYSLVKSLTTPLVKLPWGD